MSFKLCSTFSTFYSAHTAVCFRATISLPSNLKSLFKLFVFSRSDFKPSIFTCLRSFPLDRLSTWFVKLLLSFSFAFYSFADSFHFLFSILLCSSTCYSVRRQWKLASSNSRRRWLFSLISSNATSAVSLSERWMSLINSSLKSS